MVIQEYFALNTEAENHVLILREDSWESLGLQGDQTSQSWRKSVLTIHSKYWCWSWNCNTLATWFEELTYWKRPWCWERLKAGGEGDNRGWDVWMASLTRWTWVWANSPSKELGTPPLAAYSFRSLGFLAHRILSENLKYTYSWVVSTPLKWATII